MGSVKEGLLAEVEVGVAAMVGVEVVAEAEAGVAAKTELGVEAAVKEGGQMDPEVHAELGANHRMGSSLVVNFILPIWMKAFLCL